MTTINSANNQDPTLYCAYIGGPRDGLKTGDLPVTFSGKPLTGMVSKTPLAQPAAYSVYTAYECVGDTQVDGFWRFEYRGLEGPNGETLVAQEPVVIYAGSIPSAESFQAAADSAAETAGAAE